MIYFEKFKVHYTSLD